MKKKYLTALFIIGILSCSPNELFSKTPSSIQWYRMYTPHFNILFPDGFNREAKRVANTLEHLYGPVAKSLKEEPQKISVILQNKQAMTNGFSALGPRRVEFFTFPTQDYNFMGINDALTNLSVHEFRHVVQFSKINHGINKIIYKLWGENYLSGIANFAIPDWWWEGDAVGIETALTHGGRGRIPYFSLLYKTNLLERGVFSYAKQILGSFQHQIPTYYTTGYYLTTYLRRKYGAEIFNNLFGRITQGYGLLGPLGFSIALKKETGKGLLETYADLNQELTLLWKKQLKNLPITPAQTICQRKNDTYTDYLYPKVGNNSDLLVLKSGLDIIPTFVLLNAQGQEKEIFNPGFMNLARTFSVAQEKIAWNEFIPHLRWPKQSYAVIKLYDIPTQKLKTLTHKSRYNAVGLSPDAEKIVTVESDENYNHQLVILDANNGAVLQRIANPNNYFYFTPTWSNDGKYIIAVKCYDKKKTIVLINVSTGKIQEVLPNAEENVGCPILFGHYILYNAAYNEIDNIYAVNLQSGKQFQVTSRKYGAYNPAISKDGKWLFFNDFDKEGMDIAKMPFDPSKWVPLKKVPDKSIRYYAPLVAQENNSNILNKVPSHTYPVERYKPWKGFCNIHSWGVNNNDIIDQATLSSLSLSVASTDLLNTFSWSTGYLRDFDEKTEYVFGQLSYLGWYPIIDIKGKIGDKKYSFYNNEDELVTTNLSEQRLNLGVRLPLVLNNSKYYKRLQLGAKTSIAQNPKSTQLMQTYTTSMYRLLRQSKRDIISRWGQKFVARYTHTLYAHNFEQELMAMETDFYFPGFFSHHVISLGLGLQHNFQHGIYYRKSHLKRSRRYLDAYEKFKNQYVTAVNYTFPIVYPDLNLGLLLYLQRIYATLFYDFIHRSYCLKRDKTFFNQDNTQAWGLDILANLNLLTLPLMINPGVQIGYLPKEDVYLFKFLLKVNLQL